jgi:hypothetical protein
VLNKLRSHRYWFRAKHGIERYARAFAYARGRLTEDQARRMVYDIEQPSGWYHLMSLSVEDTMEDAEERFKPHPELLALIDQACAEVASNWECYDDSYSNARHAAIDKAVEYAEANGIILEPTEDWADLEGTFAPVAP